MNKNQMRKYVRRVAELDVQCFRCYAVVECRGMSFEDLWRWMGKQVKDWKVMPDGRPICPRCVDQMLELRQLFPPRATTFDQEQNYPEN